MMISHVLPAAVEDMTAGIAIATGVGGLLGALVVYVWVALALSRIFAKADEPKWAGWVPVYQFMVLAKMAGYAPAMGLLILVPLVNIVILILIVLRINEGFRAQTWFVVLAIFFSVIWLSILAWGRFDWSGPRGNAPHGRAASANNTSSTTDINDMFRLAGAGGQGQYAPIAPAVSDTTLAWPGAAPGAAPAWPGESAPVSDQPAPVSAPAWVPQAATPEQVEAHNVNPEPVVPAAPPAPPVPPVPPADVWKSTSAGAWQPGVASDWRVPAVEPLPDPHTETGVAAPAVDLPVQAGVTRMSDDSEAVAQARAAMMTGAVEPIQIPPVDESAGPIVVPGPSGLLPGAQLVPPPAVDGLTDDWASAPVAASEAVEPEVVEEPAWAVSQSLLDLSEDVSAVVGSPDAGEPRSARDSISAQPVVLLAEDSEHEVSHAEDSHDSSAMASPRSAPSWRLITPLGAPVTLAAGVVVLGRRPAADRGYPDAQLVSVADGTRTVSKTHARLELIDGAWHITDLASTNGVVLFDDLGRETELQPGVSAKLTERFLLGDAELRLSAI